MDNKMDKYSDNAFGSLFRYISQDNQYNIKIKMTVSIFEEVSSNGQKMPFMPPMFRRNEIMVRVVDVPSKYNIISQK